MPSQGWSNCHVFQCSKASNELSDLCCSAEGDAGPRPAELFSRPCPGAFSGNCITWKMGLAAGVAAPRWALGCSQQNVWM